MTDASDPRPIRLSILAILILWFALWNGLRLGETIFFWKTLREYGAHPIYISLSGGVWLITGILLNYGLWMGKAWVRPAAISGILGYSFWYWFDRLVLQKPHANWPFVLVANIIILLISFFILFSRRSSRFLKREVYERQSENSTST